MRILATNPDTLGDLVLRQPMYAALRAAGHELVLIVRPDAAGLAALVAPGAEVVPLEVEAYDPGRDAGDDDLAPLAARARAIDPDVLLCAPWQVTRIEARLTRELPRARVAALGGRMFEDPRVGPSRDRLERVDALVSAEQDEPEVEKNRRLAVAVLGLAGGGASRGGAPVLGPPRLVAGDASTARAREVLASLGMADGTYWVACVGHPPHAAIRNWPAARWGEVLGEWSRRWGRRFLLVGHASDGTSAAGVIEAMGSAADSVAAWTGSDAEDVGTLIGLLGLSRGYVGRDTGPMHIAAALGVPVLAVFGGGTWPRFVPAGTGPSVSITLGVPCAGCDWFCHLDEPVCIRGVELEPVRSAVEDLESGLVRGSRVVRLEPSREVLERIGRDGARAARAGLVRLAEASAARAERVDARVLEAERRSAASAVEARDLALELEASRERAAALAALVAQRERELVEAAGLARVERERMEGEIARLRGELESAIRQRDELLASRWRRYGQRARLVMVLPWERELRDRRGDGRGGV